MIKKLFSKYRSFHPAVKASFWFLICGFLQKGIAMLTTPVFTRVMTEVQYGRYSVYNSWYSIFQIIVSLNLAAGVYTRGLVKNEEDKDRFSSSLLGLSTLCILAWTVIYAVFSKQINDLIGLTTPLMILMLIEIWGSAAYQFWSNRERVEYRYKKLVFVTLTYVVLRPLLGVIAVLKVPENIQVEARVFTTVFVNTVIFLFLYISITVKGKHFFDKKYWLYALKFNIPLVPHYLSQIVLNQSDKLMIAGICGEAQTAYYSVAYTLAMVLQILNTSISGTMNPWIYRSIKNNKVEQIGKVSYIILVLIAVSNLLVIAAAPEFLLLLAPENYGAAIWVIPPVTASVYFMFLYNLFATYEYYYEQTYFVMIASVSGAVLNIILNYIFISKYGFLAAGYTTLTCYILYSLAHYLFMKRVIKKFMNGKKVYDVKIILLIGLLLVGASGVMMLFYELPIVRYTILLVSVIMLILFRKKIIGIFKLIKTDK
ncbi:MAG: oligosaccharide flippase family protein [Clostridia bacterium]|nr:oligosaccharide flippase family protein [Clostridia bacterium]